MYTGKTEIVYFIVYFVVPDFVPFREEARVAFTFMCIFVILIER
jgi:hypothetical protein